MRASFLKHFKLSWWMLLVYAPLSFAAIPVAFLRVETQPGQISTIGAAVTAVAVSLLTLVVVSKRLFGDRVNSWAAFFVMAVLTIGAIRGYVFVSIANHMGIDDPVSDLMRIINSTLNTGFWIFIIVGLTALVQESIHRYESHFLDKALEASVDALEPKSAMVEKIDSIPQLQSLKANLEQLLRDVNRQDVDSDTLLISALKIRDSVENSVRPLSHKIWFSEKLIRPRIRGRGLLIDLFRTPKFAPFGSALAMGLWMGIGSISGMPLGAAALCSVTVGLSLIAATVVMKWLIGNRELPALVGFAVITFASWLVASFTDFVLQLSPFADYFARSIASNLLFPAAVFLVLVVSSLFLQTRANFRFIEDLLDSVGNLGSESMRSEFAGYLHNSLQAQLTNLASQLEKAAKSGGNFDPDLKQYLAEVSQRSIGEEFASRALAPKVRLEKAVKAWGGIIDVRLDLTKLESLSDEVSLVVADLVEESISNAVRHASADWISFELELESAGVRIEIRNPSPGEKPRAQSLGTSWLASKSKSFEVSDEPDGTRLTRVLI
ncbi:MAG: hypothetical protein RIR71_133 [Actinomycetota bacterium]